MEALERGCKDLRRHPGIKDVSSRRLAMDPRNDDPNVRTDTHSSSSLKIHRSRVEDFRMNSLSQIIQSNSAILENNLHILFERVT